MTTTARHTNGTRTDHVLLAGAAVAWAATGLLLLRQPQVPLDRLALLPTTLTVVCGAIIVLRTRTRLIGWLLVIAGVLWPLIPVFFQEGPAPPPDTAVNLFLQTLGEQGNVCLLLLLLVFPTGRFDTRLARVGAVVALLPSVVYLPLGALSAMGAIGDVPTAPFAVVLTVFGAFVVLGLTMQIRRYRHRPRVEQLQIKWFLLAVGTYLMYPVILVFDLQWGPVPDLVITGSVPVAVLVAITRYRLYEIDRIISRTVGYAIVVAALGALGVGGVTFVTSLLPAQDRLAVALSTVAVVALFDPLRRGVIDVVDRRFDRTRYVARQVVEDFGRAVQDQTDLDDLHAGIHDVIGATMAPRTVAIWQPEVTA